MYRHTSGHSFWTLLVVAVLAISLVVAVIYLDLAADVFHLLGLSAVGAAVLLGTSLVGSLINIPLTHKRMQLVDPEVESLPTVFRWLLPIVHYYPPRVAEEILAVNVGGAGNGSLPGPVGRWSPAGGLHRGHTWDTSWCRPTQPLTPAAEHPRPDRAFRRARDPASRKPNGRVPCHGEYRRRARSGRGCSAAAVRG